MRARRRHLVLGVLSLSHHCCPPLGPSRNSKSASSSEVDCGPHCRCPMHLLCEHLLRRVDLVRASPSEALPPMDHLLNRSLSRLIFALNLAQILPKRLQHILLRGLINHCVSKVGCCEDFWTCGQQRHTVFTVAVHSSLQRPQSLSAALLARGTWVRRFTHSHTTESSKRDLPCLWPFRGTMFSRIPRTSHGTWFPTMEGYDGLASRHLVDKSSHERR